MIADIYYIPAKAEALPHEGGIGPCASVHYAICPSGQPAVHPLPMLCLPVSLSVCLLVSVAVHLCVV